MFIGNGPRFDFENSEWKDDSGPMALETPILSSSVTSFEEPKVPALITFIPAEANGLPG